MVFEHMTMAELAAAVDAAADQAAAKSDSESDSAPAQHSAPMSASGLDADALAQLSESWLDQS
jgi:mycobactin peptide synthetase MbtE